MAAEGKGGAHHAPVMEQAAPFRVAESARKTEPSVLGLSMM